MKITFTSRTSLLLLVLSLLSIAGLYAFPLSGNYSVGGAGANYPSLTAALSAINTEGQNNDVTFILNAGTYEGPFVVARSASTYNLLIKALDGAEVILTNPNATSSANYILQINNNSKVMLTGLKFMPSGSYSRSVEVLGDSDYLNFQSNTFVNVATTSGWNNEAVYFSANSSADADNITFALNNFQYGGYAVLTSPGSYNSHFNNWTFYLNGYTGCYGATYLKQASDISLESELTFGVYNGISLDQCSGSLEVERCNISARQYGIYLYSSTFDSSTTPQIFNNIVKVNGLSLYNPAYDTDAYGISIQSCNYVYAAHNSVENSSRTDNSTALSLSGNNLIARMNNLVATAQGRALYIASVNAANTIEYNNLYTNYTNLTKIGSYSYKSLAEYSALAGGENISVYPFYDNQLRCSSPLLDNYGVSCGVNTDYNNQPRSVGTPDLGAHEWTADPALTPLSGTVYVGTGQSFETLSEFAYALSSRGVSASVTALLSDPSYDEQVTFYGIPGGDSYHVIIKPDGADNAVFSFSGQTAAANYLLWLNRTEELKLENIDFVTENSSYSNLVYMNGYNYSTRFFYSNFTAPSGASGSSIVTPWGSQSTDLSVLAGDFFGNYYGIYSHGTDATVGSCYFNGQVQAITFTQADRLEIGGNDIINCSNSAITVNSGNAVKVNRNTILVNGTGMNLSNLAADGTNRSLISNNDIKIGAYNMRNGIHLGGSDINLLNNSIQVEGTNSFALYVYQAGNNVDMMNNIFVSLQSHAVEFTYFTPDPDVLIDYNCYYSPSNYIARFGAYYTDLASLKAGIPTSNQHSVSLNPIFTEDMHTQSPWLRRVGIIRPEVTLDMDNEPRGDMFDIGADQQTGAYGFTPLLGTYDIGTGGDYLSLDEFLTELSILGTLGNVTANLLPGTHTSNNLIQAYPMVNPLSTLTINAYPGVVFNHVAVSGPTTDNYVFCSQGVDNVIFQNLDIIFPSSPNQSIALYLNGKCDGILVQNCDFNLGSGNNTGIYATNSISNGLNVQDCSFTGGYSALNLTGMGYTSDLYNDIRIEGCSFLETDYPISVSRASLVRIISNTATGFTIGLSLSYIYGNSDILRNKFASGDNYGSFSAGQIVSLNNLVGTADQYIEMNGNIIHSTGNQMQSLIGLSLANCSYLRLYHNTVNVENVYSFEYGSALALANSNDINFTNNVFSSTRTGYAVNSSNSSNLTYSHNAYYSGGKYTVNLNNILYGPTELVTQMGDAYAVFANPLNTQDGYVTCNYLSDKGAPSYVQSDVDNGVFSVFIPIGANIISPAAALSGTKTVGPSGDFSSLSAALTALSSRGLSDNLVLNLLPGSHNLSQELSYVPNSLLNTVTINGNGNAILTNNASSDANNYILKLTNVRNLNLSGISFTPQNMTYSRSITFNRYNSDISIDNCSFSLGANSLSSDQSAAIYAFLEPYSNLSITDCQFTNFPYAVALGGSNTYPDYNTGLVISGNQIANCYQGLFINYPTGAEVFDNSISAYRYQGASIGYSRGNLQVYRNRITGNGSFALRFYQHSNANGSLSLANNYVRINNNNNAYALYLDSVPGAQIFHNTLINDSVTSGSGAFFQGGSSAQMQFANNLLVTANGVAAAFNSLADLSRYDHNLFYAASGSAAKIGSTSINSLAQWIAATGDNTSVFANPLLVSGSYELQATSPAINAGAVIAGLGFDIDNRLRNLPDLGCSEYDSSSLNAPTNLQISYNALSGEIELSWNEVSGATAYKVWYSVDPLAEVWNFIQVAGHSASLPVLEPIRFFKVSAIN